MEDLQIRLAAFHRLDELQRLHGDTIPNVALRDGFTFDGRKFLFRAQQGIFKPREMRLPLSIRTSAENPYGDELGADGFLRYRYQGDRPDRHDNVWLRTCMAEGTPLVYLHGVGGANYQALWPVFVHGDDPASLTFSVAFDDPQVLAPDLSSNIVDEARRAYVTSLAVRRLHQAAFRQKVLTAYRTTCAVCRLRHSNLLDAAHILPDSHPEGAPIVPNGLALCKIHHAAYDANIVGIRSDLTIEISASVCGKSMDRCFGMGCRPRTELGSRSRAHRSNDHDPSSSRLGTRSSSARVERQILRGLPSEVVRSSTPTGNVWRVPAGQERRSRRPRPRRRSPLRLRPASL